MAKKRKTAKKITKKRNNYLIPGIAVILLVLAVAYIVVSGDSTNKEETESKIKLPSYAYTNPLTLKAYRYATEHPGMIEQIPCYCGCGGMGHRFLRDCFINDDMTYEEHASFCDICVGENIKVQEYLAKGMSIKEARAKIDVEYMKYIDGKTNTPPVSDSYKPILTGLNEELP